MRLAAVLVAAAALGAAQAQADNPGDKGGQVSAGGAGAPKPGITITEAQCHSGAGRHTVQLSGTAQGAPGAAYLLYAEIEIGSGGLRFPPTCASWRPTTAADDPHWYKVSCFHEPGAPSSTNWQVTANLSGDKPTSVFMGLVKPNAGKTFDAHASKPLTCS
jgi:hypothetical protein